MRVALKSLRDVHLARWLAPLWASLLLLWVAQVFVLGDYDNGGRQAWHDPATFVGFALLMALHVGMYVLGFVRRPARWWYLACSSVQGSLVCGIGLVRQSWLMALLLFLPLLAEAIGVLRPPRVAIAVLAGYLLFLCLALQFLGGWHLLRGILVIVLPLVTFFSLAVLLFLQQVRARERAQASVQELETSHRQLAASIARVEELLARAAGPSQPVYRRGPPERMDLTERELEVLAHVAQGDRNKEIAVRLRVSESTIKAHLASIYSKLGVDSRASAVAAALQRQLLSRPFGEQ